MKRLWAEQALTDKGWKESVVLEIADNGRIKSISAGQPRCEEVCSILLPAPANLHSHAFQRAMAGLTESGEPGRKRRNFWTWREIMYGFLEHVTPDDVEVIAALAQVEMLEAGFATVGEFHYLHHAPNGVPYENPAEMALRICAAAVETGIGICLLPVLYEQGGCDGRPLEGGQRRFGCHVDQLADMVGILESECSGGPDSHQLGIALHSLRAVRKDSIPLTTELLPSGPFHVHAAEQIAEVEEVKFALGARPVEWLVGEAGANRNWCLVHCTQMLPTETEALARSGAVAGLCPITESNLGDGIFDGVRFLEAGGKFGVGSDSNVRIRLAEELRTLEYSQRLRDRNRAALSAETGSTGIGLFTGASEGAARAVASDSGVLAPGCRANIIELDGCAIDLDCLKGNRILDAWIFAGGDKLVKNVWSSGRHVVKDGRHVLRNHCETRYRSVRRRLLEFA